MISDFAQIFCTICIRLTKKDAWLIWAKHGLCKYFHFVGNNKKQRRLAKDGRIICLPLPAWVRIDPKFSVIWLN